MSTTGIFSPGKDNAINGGTNPYAGHLAIMSGTIYSAFLETFIAGGMINSMSTNDLTTKFPRIGKAAAPTEHQKGTRIVGTTIETTYQQIVLDKRPLIVAHETDDVEEFYKQIDFNSQVLEALGQSLGKVAEQRAFKLVAKAARTPAVSGTSFPGGGVNLNGGARTIVGYDALATPILKALKLLEVIDEWIVLRDRRDVPDTEQAYLVCEPEEFHGMRNFNNVIYAAAPVNATGLNPMVMTPNGELNRAIMKADYLIYKGVKIYRSNNLPNRTNTAATEDTALYGGDYTNTRALLFCSSAAYWANVRGIKVETFRESREQSDGMLMSLLGGGGTGRPELAIEIAHG